MEASPAGCSYSVCTRFDWILPSLLEACVYELYWIRRDAVYGEQVLRSGLVSNTETQKHSVRNLTWVAASWFPLKFLISRWFHCLIQSIYTHCVYRSSSVWVCVHECMNGTSDLVVLISFTHGATMPSSPSSCSFFSVLPTFRPPCYQSHSLPAANVTTVTQSLPLIGLKYFIRIT